MSFTVIRVGIGDCFQFHRLVFRCDQHDISHCTILTGRFELHQIDSFVSETGDWHSSVMLSCIEM